jgi:signal transduction histidine kinase
VKRLNPWLLAPGLALAAGAAFVALESPAPARMRDAALAGVTVLLAWAVAMAVRQRYPERPLWMLLIALALASALQPLVASPNALLFTLARAARPGVEVLLVWVMVAFPTGRLATRRDRGLVASLALAVLLLWVPGMMFSPNVPLPGPFVTCGAQCPENLLFVADRPQVAEFFLGAFRLVGTTILLATSVHLVLRLHQASALMRRSLAPVVLASIARTLNMAVVLATGVAALSLIVTFWAVLLAIAWGLLRGRLYTARVLYQLVTGLRRRQGAAELRDVMAEALGDPGLEVGYWDAREQRWIDATGRTLSAMEPAVGARTTRILQDEAGRPVAMLIHDRALLEEPLLLDAVASTMQEALRAHHIETALAGERLHAASAAEDERRRIERDLHDGAQQRLLALRMKLAVSQRLIEHDPQRAAALLAEMDADVGAAVTEIRALAHGMVPPLLAERGLAAALADVAAGAAIPVTHELEDIGRIDPAVERAIYFSCVEALQNVAKHAGPGAVARLRLCRRGEAVHFSIEDTGTGSLAASPARAGYGLRNIGERLRAVGGRFDVAAGSLSGLTVSGEVPRSPLAVSESTPGSSQIRLACAIERHGAAP